MVYLPFPSSPTGLLIPDAHLGSIKQAVQGQQVTVVISGKGSGKSTLVPSSIAGLATVWWSVSHDWQMDSIAEAVHMRTKLPVGFHLEEEECEYYLLTHAQLLKHIISRCREKFDWSLYGSLVIGIDDADCLSPDVQILIHALAEFVLRSSHDIRILFTCKDPTFGQRLFEYFTPELMIGPERPFPADSFLVSWMPALFKLKATPPKYQIEEVRITAGTDIVQEYVDRAIPNALLVLPGIDYLPLILKRRPDCLFYGTEDDPERPPDNRIIKESSKPVICLWSFYLLAPVPERITKVYLPNRFLLKEYFPKSNVHKFHLTDVVRVPLAKPILSILYFKGELPDDKDLSFFTYDAEDVIRGLDCLRNLNAVDADGLITEKGRKMVELGLELPYIEMAALLVDSGCSEMAAATAHHLGSGRTRKGDSMQSGRGDLHTWMNYLHNYRGSRTWCISHCLNQGSLEKASRLAKSLRDQVGTEDKPPNSHQMKAALGLNIAEYGDVGGYRNAEGESLWIHPSSVLFRKHPPCQKVAYLEAFSRHPMPAIKGLQKQAKDYYEEEVEEEGYAMDNRIYMHGVVAIGVDDD